MPSARRRLRLTRHAHVSALGVALGVALGIALVARGGHAQAPARTTADSVGRAVQAFYDWYLPRARAGGEGTAWMRAVRTRRALFAPAMIEALRRDSIASARSKDEVVGLDGDPFLDAQDFCDRYVVRRVVPQGDRFLVDVLGTGGCGAHTKPDVVVEVARVGGAWRFENFRYREPPGDLLALLKQLHAK